MKFGKEIRQYRLKQGITLTQFAKDLGISKTYLSKLERGEMSPPSVELIQKMGEKLGFDGDLMALRVGKLPKWMRDVIMTNAPYMLSAFQELEEQE